MSGDYPPEELIKGCVDAARALDTQVVIVGEEKVIHKYFAKKKIKDTRHNLEVLPSFDVIHMDENPVQACRKKKKSSIMTGLTALKNNKIDAFWSPGNTGAVLTGALFTVGRIHGIKRPAIASLFPNKHGFSLLVDAGANAECHWKFLKQFAIIGDIYFKNIYNIKAPRIGLLNIGGEASKGNELLVKTFRELSKTSLNFIGNIEPAEVLDNKADIIVCDGFTGNIFLKTGEGTAKFITGIIKKTAYSSFLCKLGAWLLRPAFNHIRTKTDAKKYGGAPLLGIKKPVYIGHGSSNAQSTASAVKTCFKGLQFDIQAQIKDAIKHTG